MSAPTETALGFLILFGSAYLLAVVGNAVQKFHVRGMERVRRFNEREARKH